MQTNKKESITTAIAVVASVMLMIMTFAFITVLFIDGNSGYDNSYEKSLTDNNAETYNVNGGYFTVLNSWDVNNMKNKIVAANDTGVKYLIITGSNGQYAITPLYNNDGTLQVYDPSSEDKNSTE